MNLISYKAFTSRSTFIDKIIGIFTFGKYSHSELQFSDGECFSISARDKVGRFKKINVKKSNWDSVKINISLEQEQKMKIECLQYIGVKYDYVGALFSFFKFCIQDKDKIYCSEVCANILSNNGINLLEGCKYTPSRLHNDLLKQEK